MPIRIWIQALGVLPLTVEQKSQINGMLEEYRNKNREFQASYGEELQLLRKSVNQDRKSDRQPDAKQIRRIRELQSRSPVVRRYQVRIWNILEESQQQSLRVELARIRATPPKPPSRNTTGSGPRPPGEKRLDTRVRDG